MVSHRTKVYLVKMAKMLAILWEFGTLTLNSRLVAVIL